MSRESTATPGGSAASPGDASHTASEAPHGAEGAALSGQPWTLRVRGKEKRVRSLRSTLRNPWVWVATVAALATGFAGRSAYDMLFNTDRQAYVNALMQARRAAGQEQAARAIQGQGSMLSAPPGGVLSPAPPAGATPTPVPAPVMAGSATNGVAGATAMPADAGSAPGSTAGPAQAGATIGSPAVAGAPGVATAGAGAPGVAPALAASPGGATPGMVGPSGLTAQSGMAGGAAAALAVPPATTATVGAAASGLVPDGTAQTGAAPRSDATGHDARRRHGAAQSRVTANRRALFAPPPGIEPTPYGVGAGLIAPGQTAYAPAPGQNSTGDNANATAHPVHRPQRERETLSPRERQQLAQRRHQSNSTNPGVIDAIKNIFQDISSRHVVPLRPEDKTRP